MEHFKGCTLKPEVPEECVLTKSRILLHCCCAPCSTAIIEWMVAEGLRPGIFFSNSNIVPFEEYEKRKAELIRYASSFGLEVIDDEYDHSAWLDFVKAHAQDMVNGPERGPRCLACFKFRLLRAANYAASHGYNILTTTLASSRWKDLNQVNEAGIWAIEETVPTWDVSLRSTPPLASLCSAPFPPLNVPRVAVPQVGTVSPMVKELEWWGQNWRKGGLQERRNFLIKSCALYNQTWCGCEFSRKTI